MNVHMQYDKDKLRRFSQLHIQKELFPKDVHGFLDL